MKSQRKKKRSGNQMEYPYVYKCSIHKVGDEDHGLRNGLVSKAVVLMV